MARVHGKRGKIYMAIASGGTAEAIPFQSKWSISAETDDVDVTSFDDGNKTYESGLPDASGDFSGFYDTATAQSYTAAVDGLARKFYLYPTTPSTSGPYWFGTVLADFTAEGAIDDAVKVSASWKAASLISKVGT